MCSHEKIYNCVYLYNFVPDNIKELGFKGAKWR